MTHPGGRPLLFPTVEALKEKIDAYFAHCEEKEKPLTVSGLAVFLDCDRLTIINYSNKDEEFFNTIKKAKQMIEAYAAESLHTKSSVAGIIFSLKNNYGWCDRQEIKHTGDANAPVVIKDAEGLSNAELLSKINQALTKGDV